MRQPGRCRGSISVWQMPSVHGAQSETGCHTLPLPLFMALAALMMFAFGLMFANFTSLAMEPQGHIAGLGDSLRPTFEIFPFFGDARQRPGAISTAWCTFSPPAA